MAFTRYEIPIVGLPYHEAPKLWPELCGSAASQLVKPRLLSDHYDLRLVAEPDNPSDPNAIQVNLPSHEMANGQARKLGYVSRKVAPILGTLLSSATTLAAGLANPDTLLKPRQGTVWTAILETDQAIPSLKTGPMVSKLTFTNQMKPPPHRRPRAATAGPRLDTVWF